MSEISKASSMPQKEEWIGEKGGGILGAGLRGRFQSIPWSFPGVI